MKIVCAFDSFKGCLSSYRAGDAARSGISRIFPDADITVVTCADGGEGMAEAVHATGIGRIHRCCTYDALMHPVEAACLLDSKTAYIDMAAAAGLALIADEEKSPVKSTTFGVGVMISEVLRTGVSHIVLGLGGSATNDAGLGALQALGAEFLDETGAEILHPLSGADLTEIHHIDVSALALPDGCRITLLCDVDNPFIGPSGAVAVYSGQKGADAEMRRQLEQGMIHLSEVIKKCGFTDISGLSGAGAAGGMAGGFVALAGASIRPGAETLLTLTGFDGIIADADLVITGEGSSDCQTLHGKLPAAVMRRASLRQIPTALLSGKISEPAALITAGFNVVEDINSPVNAGYSDSFDSRENPLDPEVAVRRIASAAARLISRYR